MAEKEINSKLHIPRSFFYYHPRLSINLEDKFPLNRYVEAAFRNGMPLSLVGEAPHVVMTWLLNGDNFYDAMGDLNDAYALKQNPDIAGANVQKLGIFAPFIDLRQDRRSRKYVTEDETAIVKAQSNFAMHLANTLEMIKANYLVGIDLHSFSAAQYMKDAGLEVINITGAKLMIDKLKREEYIDDSLETVFCGVDYGNLPLISELSKEYKYGIAIMGKKRETKDGGPQTAIRQEFLHGDVVGKRVILMDDMIDSGGTLNGVVTQLLNAGAAEIIVCATHAVLSGGYDYNLKEILKNDRVKTVLTTKTLPLRRPKKTGDRDESYVPNDQYEGGKKKIQMMEINPFLIKVVRTMLASEGDTEMIRRKLAKHVIDKKEWQPIYEELTGRPAPKTKDVGVYDEGDINYFSQKAE